MEKEFKTFKQFYPFYLSEHMNPICRGLHFIGTFCVLGIIFISFTNIENEIKIFNELLSEVNKQGNINKQIDYNDYNRLNDLLNIQLENWEKNLNKIDKITKN